VNMQTNLNLDILTLYGRCVGPSLLMSMVIMMYLVMHITEERCWELITYSFIVFHIEISLLTPCSHNVVNY
jgi:hypothetical protein